MTTVSDAPLRRSFGGLRLVLGLLVLSAIITQITDELLHDAFKPGEYFAYFTIESSLINVVVLLVAGVLAVRGRAETELLTSVRVAVLSYAVITAAVYNVLLRNIPSTGYHGVQWPNEVMHVWVPILIVIDWLFAPGRSRVGWVRLWLVVSYPLAWLAFTMLRGAVTGWYPYPFLEPGGPGGILSVLVYVLGISAFILVVASAAIVIGRVDARRPRLGVASSAAADNEPS
ncbi:Pr6Pr family membrane protein [Lacisediminihabitans profunda]|uniref:Pr6Pr family membrane protein n=1 Tax=Lacisediminihabitans profunda TaxID=2594790 RepID=A0A5C8UUH9_9MICO|nr:Pr6Pr family membrane protein [Lacisediminihabitans profunda]TXN31971.1 hypothetical protein FVP33_03345 [Lacisediminihabitans profunda]